MSLRITVIFLTLFCLFTATAINPLKSDNRIRLLLIDGQSKYHPQWPEWTPVLLKQLDESGLFVVDVLTSPQSGSSFDDFNPRFGRYKVIVSTYDGDLWPVRVQRSLERYMRKGGGLVVVHAANNAFPEWPAYNEMIGLGGWGGRTEASGPYVYLNQREERIHDTAPGPGGHHGPRHEFVIVNRAPRHPVMQGLPEKWLHAEDELYQKLRGPARNMEILATAFSAEKYEGTERHEPQLMSIRLDEGRIFHTAMGHDRKALSCVGFMTTFVRGCQWAATGKVTFPVPEEFPGPDKTSSRYY